MIKKGLENQRKNLQQLELKNEKTLRISKNKILERAKGITLIALIITIIILIILAGITIIALSGENGILRQASKAKEETRAGAVEEAKDLWKINKNIDNQTEDVTAQTLDELLADLEKQGLLTAEEVATVKETGKVTIGERTIEFESSNAMTLVEMYKNAENCEVTDGTCSDETHLHIGDYVEYTPGNNEAVTVGKFDTGYDEEQTYSVDKTTTWRVLGLSEEGNILLTSGSPIKKDGEDPYLYLQGAESYINCVNTLNKVCGVYNNPDLAEETRSITIEDINRIGGIVVEDNKVYKKDNPDTNIDVLGNLGKSYSYEAGDYAPENYMNDVYGTNVTRKSAGDEVNSDAYTYTYESLGANERVYNMLFSETTETDKYAKCYWLASPGSYVDSINALLGSGSVYGGYVCRGYPRMFFSIGVWNANRLAVRPVVSLKSEITIEEVAKSENQTDREVSWKDVYDNSNLGASADRISDNKGLVD